MLKNIGKLNGLSTENNNILSIDWENNSKTIEAVAKNTVTGEVVIVTFLPLEDEQNRYYEYQGAVKFNLKATQENNQIVLSWFQEENQPGKQFNKNGFTVFVSDNDYPVAQGSVNSLNSQNLPTYIQTKTNGVFDYSEYSNPSIKALPNNEYRKKYQINLDKINTKTN